MPNTAASIVLALAAALFAGPVPTSLQPRPAAEAPPEPRPLRTDPASQPDDDDSAGPGEPVYHECPICQEVMARVNAVRGEVVPPTVTRPSADIIIVEGATYAGTRPYSEPMRGVPIAMAEIVHVYREGEQIWFQVDPTREYEVWTAVGHASGVTVPFDFTVTVPSTRLDMIQGFLMMAIEAERMQAELDAEVARVQAAIAALIAEAESIKATLEPIGFMEYAAAIGRINHPDTNPDQEQRHEQSSPDE